MVVWTDGSFLAQLDAAFEDSARRSGPHLLCRPGCTQCCTGIFAISLLDAARLQQGFATLQQAEPARAARIGSRVSAYHDRLLQDYPGDPSTGLLHQDDASQEAFEDFANDEVCPVLDPLTGTCDLYDARPVTCRVFGPPVRNEDGLGVCELCFQGATEDEIAAAEMHLPPPEVEEVLTRPFGSAATTVGFSLYAGTAPREAMLNTGARR